jgi:hypothetical protein
MDGSRPDSKAEHDLEHTADELEDRLQHLESDLSEAERLAADRRREATGEEGVPGEEIAGDWADTEPAPAGGDDPEGAIGGR